MLRKKCFQLHDFLKKRERKGEGKERERWVRKRTRITNSLFSVGYREGISEKTFLRA